MLINKFMNIHSLRALVVEDDDPSAFLFTQYLELLGYAVDRASNGIEAIRKVENQEFDLVLMDIYLPMMDGNDATRRILKIRPRTKIIGVTSSDKEVDCSYIKKLGAVRCLKKPIDPHKFQEAILYL